MLIMKNANKLITAILSELEAIGIAGTAETSLVKFLYLSDYANACAKSGETFTDIKWKFESFGPFDGSIRSTLGLMLSDSVLEKNPVYLPTHQFDKISLKRTQKRVTFEEIGFSSSVAVQVREYLKEFGRSLPNLLNFVYYKTEPMAEAKPNEALDFSGCLDKSLFSATQKKIPTHLIEGIHQRMAELSAKRNAVRPIKWRGVYDDTYSRAISAMDADDGIEIELKGSGIFAI